jgi:hypothetical protein
MSELFDPIQYRQQINKKWNDRQEIVAQQCGKEIPSDKQYKNIYLPNIFNIIKPCLLNFRKF